MENRWNTEYLQLENFFKQLAVNKKKFQFSSYMLKFSKLKTNVDRVNFVYRDLQKYNLFPKYVDISKSDDTAVNIRREGNNLFGRGSYKEAMVTYTRSLRLAGSSKEKALAYANRSACLYKLSHFEECIKDIERALSNCYPLSLQPKLIDRRENAEKQIIKRSSYSAFHEVIPQISPLEQHPKIQCAKNCIEIDSNGKYGRYVVATKNIRIGEIIAIEQPYVSTITKEVLTHCHFCLELCYNPIPCKKCTLVLYCGESCKDQAYEEYHKVECWILESLSEVEISYAEVTSLRVVIKAKLKNELDAVTLDCYRYKCHRYNEIHNLFSGDGKFPDLKLLLISINTSYIYYFLTRYTILFNTINDDNIKELIFLHSQIAKLNSLTIEQVIKPALLDSAVRPYGFGLYSFSSLFNHSCVPNVIKVCYGNTIALKAVSTIRKGEQCYLSYGVLYDQHYRYERRILQDNFLFTCNCKACENFWDLPLCFQDQKKEFFEEYDIDVTQMLRAEEKIRHNDISGIKRYLHTLENELRRLEHLEPWNNTAQLRNLICGYYKLFGNRIIS